MKRIVSALVVIALLAVAGPATAKPKTLHYSGETDAGQPISFDLTGKRMKNLRGSVAGTCVPSSGYSRTRPVQFNPPGSFRLGKTRKASETHYVSWWGDTTFNYKVSIKKRGKKKWFADLHVNYSYTEYNPLGGGAVDTTLWICQGDDSFDFKTK